MKEKVILQLPVWAHSSYASWTLKLGFSLKSNIICTIKSLMGNVYQPFFPCRSYLCYITSQTTSPCYSEKTKDQGPNLGILWSTSIHAWCLLPAHSPSSAVPQGPLGLSADKWDLLHIHEYILDARVCAGWVSVEAGVDGAQPYQCFVTAPFFPVFHPLSHLNWDKGYL